MLSRRDIRFFGSGIMVGGTVAGLASLVGLGGSTGAVLAVLGAVVLAIGGGSIFAPAREVT